MMDVPKTNTSFGMESSALDMLAEVASATLKNDPTLVKTRRSKKLKGRTPKIQGFSHSRKNSGTDKLTLDQIKSLSDKMLIESFSELICDEMTRNYSFKCFLIPDECAQTFKSFGSEARARCKMRAHLQSHIEELETEYNDDTDFSFAAEPLQIRNKRLQELNAKNQRKKKKGKLPSTKKKSDFSEDKYFNDDMDDFNFESRNNAFQKPYHSPNDFNCDYPTYDDMDAHQNVKDSSNVEDPGYLPDYHKMIKYNSNNYYEDQSSSISSSDKLNVKHHKRKKSKSSSSTQASYTVKWDIDYDEIALNNSSQLNSDLEKTYPHPSISFHHDHTYTSVHGNTYFNVSSDELSYHTVAKDIRLKEDKNSQIFTKTFKPLVIPTPPYPYIYSPMLPHIAEIKEIKLNSYSACSSNEYLESCQESAVALPQKKAIVKDSKKLDVTDLLPSEDDEALTEDDENIQSDSYLDDVLSDNETYSETDSSTMLNSSFIVEADILKTDCPANLQSIEKKLALKCIRALRTKKKDERGPLVCQICKNKSFTAQATLMYHYRSHAGIKPFSCTVCDATFTRQHSLNYHMLIHDNKSRFECNYCGRNFRHPSHYKEHLRRHTGETPYQCIDCKLRFKTRNTYKRHLKTRHGKILSAQGIHVLPEDEFYNGGTSPRPTACSSEGQEKEHETRWSKILLEEDFFM